jgi:hypothetical protein
LVFLHRIKINGFDFLFIHSVKPNIHGFALLVMHSIKHSHVMNYTFCYWFGKIVYRCHIECGVVQ